MQFILAACFFGLGYFIYVTQLDFLISDIRRQGEEQAEMVASASVTAIACGPVSLAEPLTTVTPFFARRKPTPAPVPSAAPGASWSSTA